MENTAQKEIVSIESRSHFSMNGVINIETLDGNCVVLNTLRANVVIEGDGLKVLSLDKNTGDIIVKGEILGVFFETGDRKKKRR